MLRTSRMTLSTMIFKWSSHAQQHMMLEFGSDMQARFKLNSNSPTQFQDEANGMGNAQDKCSQYKAVGSNV